MKLLLIWLLVNQKSSSSFFFNFVQLNSNVEGKAPLLSPNLDENAALSDEINAELIIKQKTEKLDIDFANDIL